MFRSIASIAALGALVPGIAQGCPVDRPAAVAFIGRLGTGQEIQAQCPGCASVYRFNTSTAQMFGVTPLSLDVSLSYGGKVGRLTFRLPGAPARYEAAFKMAFPQGQCFGGDSGCDWNLGGDPPADTLIEAKMNLTVIESGVTYLYCKYYVPRPPREQRPQ